MNTLTFPFAVPVFKSGTDLSFTEDFLAAYEELKHRFKTKLRQKKHKKIKQVTVVKTVLKDVTDDTNHLSDFFNSVRTQVRTVRKMAAKTVRETLSTMFEEIQELITHFSKLKKHLKWRSTKGK